MKKTELEQKIKSLENRLQVLEGIKDDTEWVEINNENCPTLKNWGVQPFKIMKYKMRKDGKVWNNINFFDAQKEAKKLGYRLPHIKEMLALLEHYKNTRMKVSLTDKSFLGIEELSYDEEVYYEWIEVLENVASVRGGYWANGASAGVFALNLGSAPTSTGTDVGFRCAF